MLVQSTKLRMAVTDLFQRYGDIVKEEALWNIPVVNVVNRESIEKVLKQSGKYPFRPPNEVTAHYRKSRPDRYTNAGIVNELVQGGFLSRKPVPLYSLAAN